MKIDVRWRCVAKNAEKTGIISLKSDAGYQKIGLHAKRAESILRWLTSGVFLLSFCSCNKNFYTKWSVVSVWLQGPVNKLTEQSWLLKAESNVLKKTCHLDPKDHRNVVKPAHLQCPLVEGHFLSPASPNSVKSSPNLLLLVRLKSRIQK